MNFKKIKLTKSQRIWLKAVLEKDYEKFDEDYLKVELRKQLTSEFDPSNFDLRVYRNNALTLIGLWHIDKSNKYLKITEEVIEYVQKMIFLNKGIREFDAEVVANNINYSASEVGVSFLLCSNIGFFSGGYSMDEKIGLKIASLPREKPYDKFLKYESLENSMEKYYVSHKPTKTLNQFRIQNTDVNKTNPASEEDKIWKQIKEEFKISKKAFGLRIRFIENKHKRKALFRDIAHAYLLSKQHMPKPSIILAGGVIEELLRLYLESVNITPKENSFTSYINACKGHQLLINPLNSLSDSARHFRNFIHLEKESDHNNELTNYHAANTVASIFLIADGFVAKKGD